MSSKKVATRPQQSGQAAVVVSPALNNSNSSALASNSSAVSSVALSVPNNVSQVVITPTAKLQAKSAQNPPLFNFKGFDYQPVEDDHSYQVGINWFWLNSHSGRSGEKSQFDLSRGEGGDEVQKFAKYRQPNQQEDGNRYKVNLTDVKISKEKEIEFTFFPQFSPEIRDVETFKPTPVEVTTRPVFVDSPVLLPPQPVTKEVSLEESETPEILPVKFQMPPVYAEGFAKKADHYYLKNLYVSKQSGTGEGTYEEARYITRINLDAIGEDGKQKESEEFYKIQAPKYLTKAYSGSITKTSNNRKPIIKDQIIERYAHHSGNLITQLDLTEGTYDLLFKGFNTKASPANRDNYGFGFKVTDGKFSNPTDENETAFPENYEGHLYTESFYRSSGRAENIIGEGVTVNVVGKFNDNEEHKKYLTGSDKNPKTNTEEPALNSVYYLSNATVKKTSYDAPKHDGSVGNYKLEEFNPNKVSTLIHKGTTNIYGDKVAIVNIDNVNSRFDTTFRNEGTIIGHNERGSFSTKVKFSEEDKRKEIRVDTPITIDGNEASYHVFGTFTFADDGEDTIHNAKTGKVLLKAPKSLGIVYTSGYKQDVKRSFINDGEFKLYGVGSSGIVFNHKSKDMSREQASYANIQLNKPLEILGDNSFGANISVEPETDDKKLYKKLRTYADQRHNGGYKARQSPVEDPLTKISHLGISNSEDVDLDTYKRHFLEERDGKIYYRGTNEAVDAYPNDPNDPNFIFKDLKGNRVVPDGKGGFKYPDIVKHLENSKFNIKIGGARAEHTAESGNKENGDPNFVENSIGLNFDYQVGTDKTKPLFNPSSGIMPSYGNYQIELGETAKNSVAVRVANANIELKENENSFIKLSGENNVGLLADGKFSAEVVEYKTGGGTIPIREFHFNNSTEHNNIVDEGKNNILFAASNGNRLVVKNAFKAALESEQSTLAFATGKNSKVTFKHSVTGKIAGEKATAFFAEKGGQISINVNDDPNEPTTKVAQPTEKNGKYLAGDFDSLPRLEITGKSAVPFFAKEGGVIQAEGLYAKTSDKVSGLLYSSGENAKISFTHGILDYDGIGYAIYADKGGKIDVSNSMVLLRGSTVGFDLSQKENITREGTTFVAMSNNVFAASAKDKGNLTLSNLQTNLALPEADKIEMKAGEKDGEVFDKYRELFIDGANLTIDKDLIKTQAVDESNAEESTAQGTDAEEKKLNHHTYKLLRKYLIQRGKITLAEGKKIDAFLNSEQLKTLNRISLIGYDISASFNAKNNEDTKITLSENSTVNVDRTDNGEDKAGGIGLFVNYGQIDTHNKSTINVEKQTDNAANAKAVGIYAVNGSVIEAKGTVNVGGDRSVGLMGLSYRINENLEAQEEFLDKEGSGKVSVSNSGEVSLDGNEATGIYVENNKNPKDLTALENVKAENTGTLTLSGVHSSGITARSAVAVNKGNIALSGERSLGMIGEYNAKITNDADGNIVIDVPNSDKVSVGMVAVEKTLAEDNVKDEVEIINKGNIDIKQKGYGLYGGYKLTLAESGKIQLGGEQSVGVFVRPNKGSVQPVQRAVELSPNSEIKLTAGSTAKSIIGVYVDGNGETDVSKNSKAVVNSSAKIALGENSYNYLIKDTAVDTVLNSNSAETTIKTGSVHILSQDKRSVVTNKTAITVEGDNAFGIYTSGKATNLANISLGEGKSNVALFAIDGGEIVNGQAGDQGIKPEIWVSNTDKDNERYSIGMAAGTSEDGNRIGTVINYGTINATKDYAVGMYASGKGSVAKNYGTINLSGKNAIGMFLANGAVGENHGTITTTDTAGLKNLGIIGVLASSGATFKNYGRVVISGGANKGVLLDGAATLKTEINQTDGKIETTGSAKDVVDKAESATNLDKENSSIDIQLNAAQPKVTIQDVEVKLAKIDTPVDMSLPSAVDNGAVLVDNAPEKIVDFYPDKAESGTFLAPMPKENRLGMYIDTSGLYFTKPIEGIENIEGLETVEMVFGTEAAKYTDAKAIEIGSNILAPYNKMIAEVLTAAASEKKFTAISSGLTWIVTSKLNSTEGKLEKVYLIKVPYTDFANDVQSKKVLQGLENRYGTASLTPREREIYAKLNSLGKGEGGLFTQAVDELRGDQYANTTRRIKQSKVAYDYEFKQLMKWDSKTRETTKVKLFGGTTKYKTDIEGLKSYDQNMRGVFILNDDFMSEVKRNGTFYGLAEEQFKFKDLGGSDEKVLSGQIGYFQEKLLDDDKQYHHLMKVGIEGSYRKINRRYHIVDDIFSARAKYYSYGLFFDNQLSRKYEIDEKQSIEGKAGFDFGYLRSSKIHEKAGEMRLNLKSQHAFTLRPKLAMEYAYSKPLDDEQGKLNFYAELEVAKDFGLQSEPARRALLVNGNASEYDLAKDKDRWSVKASGRITLEKEHFGVGLRAAYDFGQKQSLLGLELRVKF